MTIDKRKTIIFFATILLNSSFAFASVVEDKAITMEVKAKLLLEKDVPGDKIDVTTKDNEVFLKGVVRSNLQADRAIELAASLKNVLDVDYNDLLVEGSATPAEDSLITAKIKGRITQLFNDSKIAAGYSLLYETSNREVHIHGTVTNSADISTIENTVKKIKNVKKVKTSIQVR